MTKNQELKWTSEGRAAARKIFVDNIQRWKEELEKAEKEEIDNYEGYMKGIYIGTIFNITPSGKLYAFWTSNQTEKDEVTDQAFWDELSDLLAIENLYVVSGQNDPCDIFIYQVVDETEDEEEDEN